jgi:hypothetical protein
MPMGSVYWISTDGTVRREDSDEEPSLDKMQEWVDGFLEHVNVLFNNKHCHMYVNGDGIGFKLPFNAIAWAIYATACATRGELASHPIVGNAVLCEDLPFE